MTKNLPVDLPNQSVHLELILGAWTIDFHVNTFNKNYWSDIQLCITLGVATKLQAGVNTWLIIITSVDNMPVYYLMI